MEATTQLNSDNVFQPTFLTQNEKLRAEIQRAHCLACSRVPLLLLGDTGVGKSWLVRDLHQLSGRLGLQTLECPALASGIVDSELFGHAKGSFTGASSQRTGLVEAANDGTLFLDEIGDLALEIQSKLLRAIQDGMVRKVGESKDNYFNVRWIAATNVDLAARVRAGGFRKDLYFRLAQGVIRIPPLRERPEDVRLLIGEYFRRKNTQPEEAISRDGISVLTEYSWPGNVRELFSVLDVALALSRGEQVQCEHLQFQADLMTSVGIDENDPGIRVGMSMQEGRRLLVEATMRKVRNRKEAAGILGIPLHKLEKWLQHWERLDS